ncbi:hypothetical protein [Martelella mediterranea]|uniref:hypothetical protein n=1 Tax=Martelella mediterranea TaxID=293089 RepID=UPI001A9F5B28|nr:hypothetical protein [Martelella mediterranea]
MGIADAGAPSWTGWRARDVAYLDRWLEEGFAVVATDYQGLGGSGRIHIPIPAPKAFPCSMFRLNAFETDWLNG